MRNPPKQPRIVPPPNSPLVARLVLACALLGLRPPVRALADMDEVFSARCEAKCLNRPQDQRIPCIASCLNGSWNKPGTCPSNGTESVLNLVKTSITFCHSDIDCSGMLKCCQYTSNNTCQPPLNLEKAGLPTIPTDLTTSMLRNPQEDEKAKILIRWTPVRTSTVDQRVVYIIEECHHFARHFLAGQLTDWALWKRVSRSSAEYKNLGERGRWFRFRVTAVNENGTLGPSLPSDPIFASSLPRFPRPPGSLKVSATSLGNGHLHILLTWLKPRSEAPIDRYKVTWSVLKNLTLTEHHYTLPSNMTAFWLHNLEPLTEYFLEVRAQASFGKRKLLGKPGTIVFQTGNHSHSSEQHARSEKDLGLKYKKRVKNFLVEKVYWLHDQLLALISWRPIKKNIEANYSVSWSHDGCSQTTKARYIAQTALTQMEIYSLIPECHYNVSVKAIWQQRLYIGHQTFSTHGCQRNESILHSIITNCKIIAT